jgi:hypothetical protein
MARTASDPRTLSDLRVALASANVCGSTVVPMRDASEPAVLDGTVRINGAMRTERATERPQHSGQPTGLRHRLTRSSGACRRRTDGLPQHAPAGHNESATARAVPWGHRSSHRCPNRHPETSPRKSPEPPRPHRHPSRHPGNRPSRPDRIATQAVARTPLKPSLPHRHPSRHPGNRPSRPTLNRHPRAVPRKPPGQSRNLTGRPGNRSSRSHFRIARRLLEASLLEPPPGNCLSPPPRRAIAALSAVASASQQKRPQIPERKRPFTVELFHFRPRACSDRGETIGAAGSNAAFSEISHSCRWTKRSPVCHAHSPVLR